MMVPTPAAMFASIVATVRPPEFLPPAVLYAVSTACPPPPQIAPMPRQPAMAASRPAEARARQPRRA